VRGFGEELIEQLNDISTKNTYPDVTFLLDVDPETGLARRGVAEDGVNRLDMEALGFHEKVRLAYLELVEQDTRDRWVKVDATQSIDDMEEDIWAEIQARGLCAD